MKVAVYGSLRRGLYNHSFLKDAEYLGMETIKGWDMYTLGSYPYCTHGNNSIVVEIYEVTDLTSLDSLEGYPHYYDRTLIETTKGSAWIYFIDVIEDDKEGKIDSGDWVTYINSRIVGYLQNTYIS